MIINIHGFGGNKENSVYRWLKKERPDEEIYGKTYDYASAQPDAVLDYYRMVVSKEVNHGNRVGIIGTSWGGFFAYCLNAEFPELNTILINPMLNPHLTDIRKHIPDRIFMNYFKLFGEHALRHNNKSIKVIIGADDEVFEHKYLTEPMFDQRAICKYEGLTHHFDISEHYEIQSVVLNHLGKRFEFIDL